MKDMGPIILDREKNKIQFRVFAHNKEKVSLVLKDGNDEKVIPMKKEEPHLYSIIIEVSGLDIFYKYRLNGEGDYPDPYSNFQPFGVNGFSQVVDHQVYEWKDSDWKGTDLDKFIIYEIHVGTFTSEGTFKAVIDRLNYLCKLGITAVELMPVAQTPGKWNWGYDGANLFSVNRNYGTPNDLKYLVDTCHQKGISVILDVVYNHLGPEGNYLSVYGPYFTDKYETAWGKAVNYDDEFCEYTRKMVTDNVRYWLTNYHFDGLRLDAVQTIRDESPTHILQEISSTVKKISSEHNRKYMVIAETDENDVKLINPPEKDGYGMDAHWMDDLHHCIHTILTGEKNGYYIDYGQIEGLEKLYQNYLYTGEYSQFWKKNRGTDASENPGHQFVVALQNHDQVGNRAEGERLTALVEFPYLKEAAGLILFSPYVPLIFMGEEYGEKNPFLFFTNFEDQELKKKVSQRRRDEFKDFDWDNIPDPEDDRTFYSSRLTPESEWNKENEWIFYFYRDFISLRKSHPVLNRLDKKSLKVKVDKNCRLVEITRWNNEKKKLTALFNLGKDDLDITNYHGRQLLNSEWKQYGGKIEGENKTHNVLYKGNMIILESN